MAVKYPTNYSQFDPLWNTLLLGFNTDAQFDFNNFACLLCQLADVCMYFGFDETPATLNEKLKGVAGFVNGGEYVDGSLSKIHPEITEKAVGTPALLTDEQMNDIRDNVNAGNPVVLGIDYNPKTIKADFHFVGALDIDRNDENDITISDSLGGRVHTLKDYLGFTKPSARDTIQKYFVYTSNHKPLVAQTVSTPEVAPVQSLVNATEKAAVLPSNYGQIIHDATEWGEVVKTYVPGRSTDSVNFANDIKPVIDSQVKTVEKTVEVPALAPDGTADAKWSQTVELLGIGKQPQDASFDDAKRVIAGIKSRQTDLQNKADDALKASAGKDVTIGLLNDKVSTLNKQVLQDAKLNKAETDSLKKNIPNFDVLKRQWQSVIDQGRADLEAKTAELANAKLQLAHNQALDVSSADLVQTASQSSIVERVITLVRRYIHLK